MLSVPNLTRCVCCVGSRPAGLSESFHDTSADDFFAEVDLSPKMLQFSNDPTD